MPSPRRNVRRSEDDLAGVRYADRIYVLDHGQISEQGDHETLMTLDGLYTLQASAYRQRRTPLFHA